MPAFLAGLLLGAHFLRSGTMVLVGACILVAILAFVPRRPLPTIVRWTLVLGVLEWVRTALEIHARRVAAGQPALRAVLIVGAVAAFTAFAAWLLPAERKDG